MALEIVPSYLTNLIAGSKSRDQKFCCATFFLTEIIGADKGALLWEHVGGMLQEQAPLYVAAPLELRESVFFHSFILMFLTGFTVGKNSAAWKDF